MTKRIDSRELWDQTPDAVLAVSPDGRVLHWNRAAEAIFGYAADEALGRLLTDLIVPPDREAEERRQQHAEDEGGVVQRPAQAPPIAGE